MTSLHHQRTSFFDLRYDDGLSIGDARYIVKKSTRGGMGFVLFAEKDLRGGSQQMSVHGLRVALKTVLPGTCTPEVEALFQRELTVWAGFRHPNIVGLNEIVDGRRDGWFAAMDWCLGSLRDVLNERKRLKVKDATDILGDVIGATISNRA